MIPPSIRQGQQLWYFQHCPAAELVMMMSIVVLVMTIMEMMFLVMTMLKVMVPTTTR